MPMFVAFFRGINVGSSRRMKMADLRAAFQDWGYAKVSTVLASGNVLFEAPSPGGRTVASDIRSRFHEMFGYEVSLALRSVRELQGLAEEAPFREVPETPESRFYVTFLTNRPRDDAPQLPYHAPDHEFTILERVENNVFSYLTLSENTGTLDLMAGLERVFGEDITTRNWNTVTKILQKADS